LAEISSPLISGITLHAMVGSEAVVGSINFPGRYDLFIAIPAPAANASTKSLQGTYQTGSLDFPGGNDKMARSAFFTLTPDGAGSFGAFTPSGSAANLPVPPAVTIAGATYSVNSDGSGSATFPLPSGTGAAQALVGGSKLIYVSADGAVLLGGSGTGFDMIIGLQKLTIDPATAYPGLYYYAGLYYDLSSGSADLYNEIGGRNVQSSAASVSFSENESIGGNLYLTDVNSSGPAEVPGSDGVAAQDSYYRVAGAGGQMYFAAGRQTRYYLAVGVKTRPLTLSGVFLSPYGVVDAGNFGPPPVFVAPGEFLSLFGSGFASASETASSYPLPSR